jgi:hypothetical protein
MTGEERPKVERSPSGELKVYPAGRRLRLAALLGVVMTAISLNALVSGEGSTFMPSGTLIKIFGALGVLFFGSGTIALLVRSFGNRPVVVLNKEGVLSTESIFRPPLVRWNEITDVAIDEEMGQRSLHFVLRDPEAVARRCRSPISRAVYGWAARSGKPVVSVSERHAGISLEELKKEAEARMS